jgi:microcystin-dependent protein
MSEPFYGEIKMFAGNFAPRSWALCDGQLLSVSQNDALFSLLGTIYGGDGRTTFGLPDLRGRLPIHVGSGPALTPRRQGEKIGQENVALNTNQIPSHTHQLRATDEAGDETNPSGQLQARTRDDAYRASSANTNMAATAISASGSSQSHPNIQPFLCINFIIALFGVYPSRT